MINDIPPLAAANNYLLEYPCGDVLVRHNVCILFAATDAAVVRRHSSLVGRIIVHIEPLVHSDGG